MCFVSLLPVNTESRASVLRRMLHGGTLFESLVLAGGKGSYRHALYLVPKLMNALNCHWSSCEAARCQTRLGSEVEVALLLKPHPSAMHAI